MKTIRADTVIKKWMKDPKFVAACKELEPEYTLARTIIEARINEGLSQAELAERMGTTQPVIARMESGRQSMNVATLHKLAKATNTKVQISLVRV